MYLQDKPENKPLYGLQNSNFFIPWYTFALDNWLVVHFFSFDEKKRTKPASPVGGEKSRQNNACLVGRRASTRIAIAPPAVLSSQHARRNNNQTKNMLVNLLF